ncbi:MAG: alpha/beta hydrolase [Deltaproteobacteria bacterium]|nr:alpha/beta hydrolase [Deltaproteobacteria bacterium]
MTPKTIQANGLRFAYLEQGTGPLVLLVHGFPDTAHTWDGVMPALAEAGYRAVAPFTRGYAPTEIPTTEAFDTDTLGQDVLGLIDALGGGPAVVVGHDWGASAAYSAAALGPDRVRLLVTLAIPHPGGIRPTPALVWKLRHFFSLRRKNAHAKLAENDFAYLDELWRRWSPSWKAIPTSETDQVKAAFREPGSAAAACGYYRAQSLRSPESYKLKITVPAVCFAGEHDMIAPRLYEKSRGMFTSSYEVVQVPGGHFMHREHPVPFRTELVRVLREHDAKRV